MSAPDDRSHFENEGAHRTAVVIDYTNWRGERRERTVQPISWRFGSNHWHTKEQWLLLAWDCGVGKDREFAMRDIHSWRPFS